MWPSLSKPRLQNRGKPDEKEVWQVDMLLPMSDAGAQAFSNYLRGLFVAAHGNGVRPGANGLPYKRFTDQEGKETDLWIIKFARNCVTRRGTPLPPPVVTDSQGNAWPGDLLIGNGSTGKVAFSYFSWDNEGGKGLSLQMEAVRVISFQPYAPPSPVEAFGDPEPGYVLPAESLPTAQAGSSDGWGDSSDWGGAPSTEEPPW